MYLFWSLDDGPEHGLKHVAVTDKTNVNNLYWIGYICKRLLF
jgi:hypothetical protein